jgi:hypothetical protein
VNLLNADKSAWEKRSILYTVQYTYLYYIKVKTEEYIVRDVAVISEVKPNFYKIGTEYIYHRKYIERERLFKNILSVEYPFCGVDEMID